MATYLYGIVRRPEKQKRWGTGVGKPPGELRLVEHSRIAALVSDVGAPETESEGRALRRDLRAHEEVVRRAMDFGTVLPVSFGTIFDDDEQLVRHLLRPNRDQLRALLDEFDGLVELTLKADFIEQEIIRAILRSDHELRAWNAEVAGGAFDERVAFGEALSGAIEQQAAIQSERLLVALEPLCEDLQVRGPGRGVGILNASFLVAQQGLKAFDHAVEQLAAEARGLIDFDYVGPLPPYSFINLEVGSGET